MRTLPSRFPVSMILALLLAGPGLGQTTSRLSVGGGGAQADGLSGGYWDQQQQILWVYGFSVSGDGRYVAFCSLADDLVPGDTNGVADVFVRDRTTGSVTRASVGAGGGQADGPSYGASLSADGRFVAFNSAATNLVPGDTNGKFDTFVRDLLAGTTVRASVSSSGVEGDGDSNWLAISADGSSVVFVSQATTLVPGDTNGKWDVFVRDLAGAATTRVSVGAGGTQGDDDSGIDGQVSLSSDGRFVVFSSRADNLVASDTNGRIDIFVRDRVAGTTELASVNSLGNQGDGDCYTASISGDGRFVALDSESNNLDAGDTNGARDVFVRDRLNGTTRLVSWDFTGNPSNDFSQSPAISADGSHVAFLSGATDLVPGDSNGSADVFVRDLQTASTSLASVSSAGIQANWLSFPIPGSISADGRFTAFASGATNLVAADTNGTWDVFLHDLQTGTTTRESVQGAGVQCDRTSYGPAFSDGARYVAFASWASNLVPGDVNDRTDVFVRDLQTGATTLASVSSSGAQGNQTSDTAQVSSDGRYVAFFSISTTLVPGDANGTGDVFVRDLVAGTTEFATLDASGAQVAWPMPGTPVSMSSDGRYVAFHAIGPFVPADTNGTRDVYVRDRTAATTIRASVGSSGAQGNGDSSLGSLSADGRYVVFSSTSSNLVAGDTNGLEDVFVRDLVAGTTTRVSLSSGGAQADGQSLSPSISPDGRYVAFWSDATNLVAGDTNGLFDVFVRDLQAGTTTRESVDSNGVQANGTSTRPSISRGGRYVVFVSDATNLVQGDTNGVGDVFLRDRLTGQTTRVSVSTAGVQGDQFSSPYAAPAVSADGRLVAFDSYAANLVSGDTNGVFDVFLRDRGDAADFAPFCFGDGSSGPCPCGNQGGAGRGCQNSVGTGGALLTGTGVPSLAADTVHLTSSGELPAATSILLQGTAVVAPSIYGDGLRCTGGSLKRLFTHSAVAGSVTMPQGADPSISARSAAMGAPIPTGASRLYQVYYRDPSTSFCPTPPGSTFNVSSAVAIVWGA
jgi:Tol biopolymer transport system component